MDKKEKEKEPIVIYASRRFYSEELKHVICKEHIELGHSFKVLVEKYNLSSHSMIHDWLRKLGYIDSPYRHSTKIVHIGIHNYNQMPQRPTTQVQPSPIQGDDPEIVRLKRELQEAQLKAEAYQRMVEIAEDELKIPIRKKYSTK
jgi:hypothetical protein